MHFWAAFCGQLRRELIQVRTQDSHNSTFFAVYIYAGTRPHDGLLP